MVKFDCKNWCAIFLFYFSIFENGTVCLCGALVV